MGNLKTLKLGAILAVLLGLNACTMHAPYSSQGNISIQADEKGMRAFSDMLNGHIAEGKASPNQRGSYFGMRASQETTLQQELQRRFSNESK